MAVEAHHLNLFSPQLLNIRQMMNPIDQANVNLYNNNQIGYGVPLGTTTETLLPMYNSVIQDSISQKMIKSENNSSLTNNLPLSSSRKRTRDHVMINPLLSSYNPLPKTTTPFSFLGHDISLQVQQQQFDIDQLISQHMEKVRIEIEERRKKQAKKILEAIEENVMNKLRSKQDEIEKMGKLNWALEERVKSLCMENQIWRDLAQTNEATANALRTNLEQVLSAQLNDHQQLDDAQSCCGSNFENGLDEEEEVDGKLNEQGNRLCRNCKKEESCVLILPCRHLCLCTVCGSSLHICPVCNSSKNASVHVNLS